MIFCILNSLKSMIPFTDQIEAVFIYYLQLVFILYNYLLNLECFGNYFAKRVERLDSSNTSRSKRKHHRQCV